MTRKESIEKAKSDGVIQGLVRQVSAMYLLHSVSAIILDDTKDYLQGHGMKMGPVKWEIEKLNKAFDRYFEKVGKLVSKDQFANLTDDMIRFEKIVKEFAGIEVEQLNNK